MHPSFSFGPSPRQGSRKGSSEVVLREEKMSEQNRRPIAKEGFPFLIPVVLLTVILGILGWKVWMSLGILLSLFIAYFFRNPRREIPNLQNIILSPADGRIVHVGECEEDRFLKEKTLKVSIFMSLFDVHLNRAPVSGKVLQRDYLPGRFLVANVEKSSLLNEQNAVILETEDQFKILLIQIAGFVARRIVCYAKTGDLLRKGEIFGLIRFGSRFDLYLPPVVKPIVWVGQHVKGGESIIGYRA
jgi:phosphatidylserine decarboxylase